MTVTLEARGHPVTHAGSPAGVICPRCRRLAVGWPARRADLCSPGRWQNCIRSPHDIAASGRPFGWVMLRAPLVPVFEPVPEDVQWRQDRADYDDGEPGDG